MGSDAKDKALAPAGPAGTDVGMRPATPADLPALAQLYADAFEGNAAYRWIFTGDYEQPAPEGALPWLFLRQGRMMLRQGCPLLVACGADGELVGAGGLVPFDRKPGKLEQLKRGILLWPLRYGWASLRRALSLDGGLAALQASGALAGVAGELHMIAVRADMQARAWVCCAVALGVRLLAAANVLACLAAALPRSPPASAWTCPSH